MSGLNPARIYVADMRDHHLKAVHALNTQCSEPWEESHIEDYMANKAGDKTQNRDDFPTFEAKVATLGETVVGFALYEHSPKNSNPAEYKVRLAKIEVDPYYDEGKYPIRDALLLDAKKKLLPESIPTLCLDVKGDDLPMQIFARDRKFVTTGKIERDRDGNETYPMEYTVPSYNDQVRRTCQKLSKLTGVEWAIMAIDDKGHYNEVPLPPATTILPYNGRPDPTKSGPQVALKDISFHTREPIAVAGRATKELYTWLGKHPPFTQKESGRVRINYIVVGPELLDRETEGQLAEFFKPGHSQARNEAGRGR